MSNGRTNERPIPHGEAWPLESRRSMMREVVKLMAEESALHRIDAPAYASTYGVSSAEVEAEMMRHLPEGEGK